MLKRFKRSQPTINISPDISASAERAPAEFSAECIGETCPNWSGQPCAGTKYIWKSAKATITEDRDTSQPPLLDEAVFVTYGQFCLKKRRETMVSARIDDYDRDHFTWDQTGLVIHGDSRFSGIDVEVYQIGQDDQGQRTEDLTHTFDGWG